jgi:hypothetical protein
MVIEAFFVGLSRNLLRRLKKRSFWWEVLLFGPDNTNQHPDTFTPLWPDRHQAEDLDAEQDLDEYTSW